MVTKRKVVKAKRATAGSSRPKKAKAVFTEHVSTVFSTAPETSDTVQVPEHSVALFVKGRSKGVVDTTGQRLGSFVTEHAQRAGIRSFSVYVDGLESNTSHKDQTMAGISKIEIVAKDARG